MQDNFLCIYCLLRICEFNDLQFKRCVTGASLILWVRKINQLRGTLTNLGPMFQFKKRCQ